MFLDHRGYTPEVLDKIDDPSHPDLLNIDKLTSILKQIHDTQEKIVIMPDFDADGISAATVGYSGLAQLGFNVGLYVPHAEQGYGINISDIDNVLKQFPDVKYIITCDVGITCYEAFFYAYNKGLKVLVTDHHEELEKKPVVKIQVDGVWLESEPKLYCETIVDPCQIMDTYPLKNICGAHVFWQVLDYYARHYDPANISLINQLRVFAGIGTLGDMMDLTNENRLLIKDTIEFLKFIDNTSFDELKRDLAQTNSVYASSFLGLKLLISEMTQQNIRYNHADLDEKFLSWTMIPIYNSVKRMGRPMNIIFNMFFGATDNIKLQAVKLALDINQERKQGVKDAMAELLTSNQPFAPFIYLSTAPGGMLGLLANNLMRSSGVPTFVIDKDKLTGSGRSLPYFPVITQIQRAGLQNKIVYVAGHEEAFGIRFDSPEHVAMFYNYLVQYVVPIIQQNTGANKKRAAHDLSLNLGNVQDKHDAELDPASGLFFIKQVKTLKPFGVGFSEPRIEINADLTNAEMQKMGKDKQHLKIMLPNGVNLISWNNANKVDELAGKHEVHFNGVFEANEFRGRTSLQVQGDVD